jgi:GGDEF domain-containing protein
VAPWRQRRAIGRADALGGRGDTTTGENLEPIGPITISIGLAAFPEHGGDIVAIADLVDAALLQAKQQGLNRVVVWRPALAVDLAVAR